MTRIEILERADPFAFVHPLVRHSLYDGLSVVERDAAHAAAAARLEETGHAREAVAAHLAATRPARSGARRRDARRRGGGRRGARRAGERRALAAARARGGRARAAARRAAARARRGGGARPRPRRPRPSPGGARATRRTRTSPPASPATSPRSSSPSGRWEDGVATASRALAALGDRDPDLALGLEMLRATMRAQDPRLVADFDRDRRAPPRARVRRRPGARGRSPSSSPPSQAARGEHLDDVRAVLERERYDGTPLDGRIAGTWATAHVWALALVDEDARARAVVDALAAHARETPAVAGALVLVGLRGWLDAREGALKAAEAAVRPGIELSLRRGRAAQHRGQLLVRRGRAAGVRVARRPRRRPGVVRHRPGLRADLGRRDAPRDARSRPPHARRPRRRGRRPAGERRDERRARVAGRCTPPGGRRSRWRSRRPSARRRRRSHARSCAWPQRPGCRGRTGSRCVRTRCSRRAGRGSRRWRRRSRCSSARRRASSWRGRGSSSAPRCAGRDAAPTRASRSRRGASWPTRAAPTGWSPGRATSCARPARGPAGSRGRASTRSPPASCVRRGSSRRDDRTPRSHRSCS